MEEKVYLKRRNKTFEEIYGEEKAKKVKEKMKILRIGKLLSEEIRKKIGKTRRMKIITGEIKISPKSGFNKERRSKLIIPKQDTKIEVKIQTFLKFLGIEHLTHFWINEIEHKYQCDIFIPVQNGILQKTVIECDGDFMHCNPLKYQQNFVRFPKEETITAKEIWEKDKIRTKELEEKGFRVIRLWEKDIKKMEIEELKNILNSTGG